jgi:hypothetical protein
VFSLFCVFITLEFVGSLLIPELKYFSSYLFNLHYLIFNNLKFFKMKSKIYLVLIATFIMSAFILQSCQSDEISQDELGSKIEASQVRNILQGPTKSCQSCDEIRVTYELVPVTGGCEYKVTITNGSFGEFCGHRYLIGAKPFNLESSSATIFVKAGQVLTVEVFNPLTNQYEQCYKNNFKECINCETIDCSLVQISAKKLDVRSLRDCCVYSVTITNDNNQSVYAYNLFRMFDTKVIEAGSALNFKIEVCDSVDIGVGGLSENCDECEGFTLKCKK